MLRGSVWVEIKSSGFIDIGKSKLDILLKITRKKFENFKIKFDKIYSKQKFDHLKWVLSNCLHFLGKKVRSLVQSNQVEINSNNFLKKQSLRLDSQQIYKNLRSSSFVLKSILIIKLDQFFSNKSKQLQKIFKCSSDSKNHSCAERLYTRTWYTFSMCERNTCRQKKSVSMSRRDRKNPHQCTAHDIVSLVTFLFTTYYATTIKWTNIVADTIFHYPSLVLLSCQHIIYTKQNWADYI